MNTSNSSRSLALIVTGITVASLIIWVGGIFMLGVIFWAAGYPQDLWAMMEALSTALGAAIVLAAGFVAYQEINELTVNRHLEIVDRIFQELNSQENIEARRWVFQNLSDEPEKGLRELNDEGRDAMKRVLNSLDRVAFLTQTGWIPDDLIMAWMNPMVVKAWLKLEPYVNTEAERRQEPDYYQNVRTLGAKCLAWRKENISNSKVIWLDDAL